MCAVASNKEESLLESAFKLFTEKGVKNTSIQDIVNDADVGKGTFYLYFKDKYEIRDVLIAKKSNRLFNDAIKSLRKTEIKDLTEQVIYVVDYVIDYLKKNPILLKFFFKNLSLGLYNKAINKIYEDNGLHENTMLTLFLKGIEESNLKIKNPEVTLYMIIELVSSTCFNSIIYDEPLPIEEFKPHLHNAIRKLINE